MASWFEKAKTWIEIFSAEHPVKLALWLAISVLIIVVTSSFWLYGYDPEFIKNIFVEAHGMLLDLLVIGFFVFWLNLLGEKTRERSLNIQRYQEEIEDYLGWNEPEATYRIVGNIKRLNREGISNINLRGANLRGANLRGANLGGANLEGANLWGANLRGANLEGANLEGAYLSGAFLKGANLSEAKYNKATTWSDSFNPEGAGARLVE